MSQDTAHQGPAETNTAQLLAELDRMVPPGIRTAIVRHALRKAGLTQVPDSDAALAAFVLGPVRRVVASKVGDSVALARLLRRRPPVGSGGYRQVGVERSGVFQSRRAGKPSIVLAMSDVVVRAVVQASLAKRGFEVLCTLDWSRAVWLAQRDRALLAIYDTNALGPTMPLVRGLLASALATELTPIVITGSARDADSTADATVLGRPLELGLLLAAVEREIASLQPEARARA